MIDGHVHLIGNGSSGSGATLSLRSPQHRILARFLLKEVGLPASALRGNLDELYRDRLVELVEDSPLSHAVILAHEQAYTSDGRALPEFGSMYVPNDSVLSFVRRSRKLLPAVSIHPVRRDALYELDRCVDAGAVMMKCLPNCQNIDCSDRRYQRFWERMAYHRLPLLAHTGGELSLRVYDARLADPTLLEHPLSCGVTVIAAHCGTSSLLWDRNYLSVIGRMMEVHPNLYGDNSGMQTPFRSRHFKALLGAPFHRRIVHGSDFPIPVSGLWSALRGLVPWRHWWRTRNISNPLNRDIEVKRAMGFSPETFERLGRLLPRLANESDPGDGLSS